MIELALRKKDIFIDLEEDQAPGLGVRMLTLSDDQAAGIVSKSVATGKDEAEVNLPLGEMLALFSGQFVAFEGDEIKVEGDDFDAAVPGHLESIPMTWKMKAVSELVAYATSLPEGMEKN